MLISMLPFFHVFFRTADATQGYSKGGGPSSSQTVPRSAASPLSPPRPGPGAAGAANYPSFGGAPARESPLRYVQNNSYVPAFIRDASPFSRVPQVQQIVTEYRQAVPSSVTGGTSVVPNSIVVSPSISIVNNMDVGPLHSASHHIQQIR